MLKETENPDIQVRIEHLDNGGQRILKCINPNEIRRTLGCNLNTTNDNTEVTVALVTKSRKYNEALLASRMTVKQHIWKSRSLLLRLSYFPSGEEHSNLKN